MEENKKQNYTDPKNVKVIHTYLSDMAEAVRENEGSVIKIAMAEQNKRETEREYREAEGTETKKTIWVVGGIIFVILAIAISYFLIQKKDESNIAKQKSANIQTIISYESSSMPDTTNALNKLGLVNRIKTETSKVEKAGSIKSIFLTKRENLQTILLPLKDFIYLMEISAPDSLIRSIVDQPYMIGSYTSTNTEEKPHLFLIFETKDYNRTYAGMLEWEKTMLDDLYLTFRIDVSGNNKGLFEKPWKDTLIDNRDARVLYNADGKDVLYYIFTNKNNLIIADSKEAIREIIARLITKNTKPL